jgi:hypothetical protein
MALQLPEDFGDSMLDRFCLVACFSAAVTEKTAVPFIILIDGFVSRVEIGPKPLEGRERVIAECGLNEVVVAAVVEIQDLYPEGLL